MAPIVILLILTIRCCNGLYLYPIESIKKWETFREDKRICLEDIDMIPIDRDKIFTSDIYLMPESNLSPRPVYGFIEEIIEMKTCCTNGLLFYGDTISHTSTNLIMSTLDYSKSKLSSPYFPDAVCGGSFMNKETICKEERFKVITPYDRSYSPIKGWAKDSIEWSNTTLNEDRLSAISKDFRYKWVSNTKGEGDVYSCKLNSFRIPGYFSKSTTGIMFEPTHLKMTPMILDCKITICQRTLFHTTNGLVFEVNLDHSKRLGSLRQCSMTNFYSSIKKSDYFSLELEYDHKLIKRSDFCLLDEKIKSNITVSNLLSILKNDYPSYPGIHVMTLVLDNKQLYQSRLFEMREDKRIPSKDDELAWNMKLKEYEISNYIWYINITFKNNTVKHLDISDFTESDNILSIIKSPEFNVLYGHIEMNNIEGNLAHVEYSRHFSILGFNGYYVSTALLSILVTIYVLNHIRNLICCSDNPRSNDSNINKRIAHNEKPYKKLPFRGKSRNNQLTMMELLGGPYSV